MNDTESIQAKENNAAVILNAGIAAGLPSNILPKILKKQAIVIGKSVIKTSSYSSVRIVAFGKAALSMALAFDNRIRVRDGIVVIPEGIKIPKRSKFEIIVSTHPAPSQKSIDAANAVISYLQSMKNDELVVFLVSGGSSALVELPDGITLDDAIRTNDLLLRSGANISEVNCIRKHLSKIKGGKLVSDLRCDAIALLFSDVKSNDMTTIASGITYCDKTTFAQALKIIRKYKLDTKLPKNVIRHLLSGTKHKIPETPKKPVIRNFVIASNKICINAMQKKSQSLSYNTQTTTVFGKVEEQATKLVKIAPTKQKTCLIFGGETTVLVRGNGAGGRNQELVLQILDRLRNDLVVGSIGTDGIDGNTKYAGALIHSSNADKSKIKNYLKTSNSAAYFQKYGGHFETGPTQTNLLDIGILLS